MNTLEINKERPNVLDYNSFFDWFKADRTYDTLNNQLNCISAAKVIKNYLNGNLKKLPNEVKWLYNKLTNENNDPTNYLVEMSLMKLIDEIIDPNNASSKKHFAKPSMKQGVENKQIFYLKERYGMKFNHGSTAKIPICASGANSYRFTSEGEFKKGIKKSNHTSKSIDSLFINDVDVTKFWTTQKVTTDNGGATNSVNDDIIKFLKPNMLYLKKNPNTSERFVYLLDGPYWERKNRKDDELNRIELLREEYKHPNIIIMNSDEFGKAYGNK
jgi:hypothetical protein